MISFLFRRSKLADWYRGEMSGLARSTCLVIVGKALQCSVNEPLNRASQPSREVYERHGHPCASANMVHIGLRGRHERP